MNNVTIICPTARLAHSIKNDIAKQHINAGQTQWQSPQILTLAQWLDGIIEQRLLAGHIATPQTRLSPINEQILWQQVIQQSLIANSFSDLFDVSGLASAAIEANQYTIAWGLHVPREHMAEETRQFIQWQRAFQQRCKQLNVLESVRYLDFQLDVIKIDALEANIHAGCSLANIARIEFAGFDQTNPQEQRLRQILVSQNIEVAEYVSTNTQAAHTQHIALENQEVECRAAVAWAKQQLTANPNLKLAIVSPQLSTIRNQLADLLDDVFYSASVRSSQHNVPRCYNFSLGTPLSQQPMIQSALNLLRLFSSYEITQADVSAVLLSPFWSANQLEADACAQLDAKMREYLPMQFKRAQFITFANQQASKGLNIGHLLAHINAAEPLLSNKKLSASQWSQTLAHILAALHWPGERTLTSIEYQAHSAWQKALGQLQHLTILGSDLSQAEAVQILQKICADQVFQAETETETSIQILGVMEALSAPVDAIWCMGMNDHVWPPPARANPLLPAFIQRAAKLPNADNSVQAEFAAKVQQRLLHSANSIVFSSSKMEGNSQLRPSPLMTDISTLDHASLEHAGLAETLAETLSHLGNEDLQLMNDHTAPAVRAGEHVGGGTGLFRAQAICPAWAFYQFRLGAKALKTPSNGLDSMTRGILVHGVLAEFYAHHHFSDLRVMSDENLAKAIHAAIKIALNALSKQRKTLSGNLLALEHERLFKLVGDWLAYESARDIPFEIIACEADKKVMIGGIEVTLKIDRIHKLESGGIEFVDYKTGQKPNMNSWGKARIIEPQLPIYAVFYGEVTKVAGVQFGMVKTAEHAFLGVNEINFELEIDKRKPKFTQQFTSWQHLLHHWQTSIEAIAVEVKTGEAAIKFDDQSNLAYCEVMPLLRLPERQLQFERFKGRKS